MIEGQQIIQSQQQDGDPINWARLLNSMRNHRVIPVIGPGLIEINIDDKSQTYDQLIARRLAESTKLDESELPVGMFSLNAVVSACRRKGIARYNLSDRVSSIVKELKVSPPESLRRLAAIKDFDLYVTSTFDPLLEIALRDFGALQTKIYNPTDQEDTDLPKPNRATAKNEETRYLYYLFGKAEENGQDFVISDEDVLRFVPKLYQPKYRPKRLFDAIRENDLLLLGINFGDWLARFFLWLARDREQLTLDKAQSLREYLADGQMTNDSGLVLFLESFSQSTMIYRGEAAAFVDQLYTRWRGSQEVAAPPPREFNNSLAANPPDSVQIFVSYSRTDKDSADTLYRRLKDAHFQVWYDNGEGDHTIEAGDLWQNKIDRAISACAIFIPLLSQRALQRDQGTFYREWNEATSRQLNFAPGVSFIVPIAVDDDDVILKQGEKYAYLPPVFREVQAYHCPHGELSDSVIASIGSLLKKRVQDI